MSDFKAEIKGQIRSISAHMKDPVYEQTGFPRFPIMPKWEIDPTYSTLQLFVLESNDNFAKVTMKKEDIKRLKLMVDDFIRIRFIAVGPSGSADAKADHSAEDNSRAIVRAEIVSISIDSRTRAKEYEKMKNKQLPENFQQDFNFSPFAMVGLTLRYHDANSHDMMSMKKDDLMRLNVTAGDTIFLELSRLETV